MEVAPEFESLSGPVKTFSDLSLPGGVQLLDGVRGDAMEIEAEFAVNGFATFGFELRPLKAASFSLDRFK